MIGIYKITNKINNDCYVGQSTNIYHRWKEHKYRYNKRKEKCYSYYLYRAFRKYGLDNFKFEILETCKKEDLTDREQHYYDLLTPKYNMIYPKCNTPYESVRKFHKMKCHEKWESRSNQEKQMIITQLQQMQGGRKQKRKVKAININTKQEIIFESMLEAQKILHIARSSISQIINPNHIRKTAKGYTFKSI